MEFGNRVGHYEIVDRLGAGGMGHVYRARDTRLGRDVAIKVLREDVGTDPSWLARFEREAKLLASLSHPNIATVFGFDESDGVRYIAMELVEGESLAQRLGRGALPLSEALIVCAQIARGLDAAHLAGVIHRDLKPGNVMLTSDGDARLVDLGIACATPAAEAFNAAATRETDLTHKGMLLGTLPYMSPEQVRGEPIDARSDVWALGCTLYECLAGRHPFARATAAETVSAILSEEPNWSLLPDSLPSRIRRLLGRMLTKDLRERQRSAGDAGFELLESIEQQQVPAPSSAVRTSGPLLGSIAVAVLAIVATVIWLANKPEAEPRAPRRMALAFAPNLQVPSTDAAVRAGVVISADGQTLAYKVHDVSEDPDDRVATPRIGSERWHVQRLDELTPRMVIGANTPPRFSPDGRWLVFRSGPTSLSRVSLDGGEPQAVCDTCQDMSLSSPTWASDGYVYFGSIEGLQRVSASGGEPEFVTRIDTSRGERAHDWPSPVPGSNAIVFRVSHGGRRGNIEAVVPATGQRRLLIADAMDPRVLPSGHLVFAREPNHWVAPFDTDALAVTGPEALLPEEFLTDWYSRKISHWSASDDGQLVYVPDPGRPGIELVRVNRLGAASSLGAPLEYYGSLEATRDGQRIAVSIHGEGSRWDAGVYDVSRGTLTRMTTEPERVNSPRWSPDEQRLAFAFSSPSIQGIVAVPVVRNPEPELLVEASGLTQYAIGWTRDGSRLLHVSETPETGADIEEIDLRTGETRYLVQSDLAEYGIGLSPPDDRWLAYIQRRQPGSGWDLFVQSYPDAGTRVQISTDGAVSASWDPSGNQLYYSIADRIMAVSVPRDGESSFGRPRELFRFAHTNGFFSQGFSAVEGGEFIFMRVAEEPPPVDRLILVDNWFDQLEQLAPTGR